jgi:hypothetical protein
LALLLAASCATGPQIHNTAASVDQSRCGLTEADLIANRKLTWREFDQDSSVQNNWRSLVKRNCDEAVVHAYADYLVYGPVPEGERWQTTARFHLGQSLAHAGRNQEAAQIIATARREKEEGEMRWNLYIQGTYAFLVGDRPGLTKAFEALKTQPGPSNAINAGVLAGLLACWNKPYRQAAAPACVKASGYQSPVE